jgi:hypothetical protein
MGSIDGPYIGVPSLCTVATRWNAQLSEKEKDQIYGSFRSIRPFRVALGVLLKPE